jgi:transcription initiation factor TFIIB
MPPRSTVFVPGNSQFNENVWNVFNKQQNEIVDDESLLPKQRDETLSGCDEGMHGKYITDYSSGSLICGKCGSILKNRMISQDAEWRNLKSNNQYSSDPVRCSIVNPLLPVSSLSTRIVTNGKENSHLARRNRWQSMPHSERSIYEVFQEYDKKGREHGVSKCILTLAKQLYAKVYQKNTKLLLEGKKREGLRGGKRKGLIAAGLKFACKLNGTPFSQTKIAEILGYNKSDVTRGCKIFLNLIRNDTELISSVSDLITGHHFIRHFGALLRVEYHVVKHSIEIYNTIKDMRLLSGPTAPSIASGCLYIVLNNLYSDVRESTIADSCGISKVTVSNVYKELTPYKTQLLTTTFVRHYCDKLQINNALTVYKIENLASVLSKIDVFKKFHPQVLAATLIYYVIHNLNKKCVSKEFQTFFWNCIQPWSKDNIIKCGKQLILYQNSISNRYFKKEPIFPFVTNGISDIYEEFNTWNPKLIKQTKPITAPEKRSSTGQKRKLEYVGHSSPTFNTQNTQNTSTVAPRKKQKKVHEGYRGLLQDLDKYI